MAASPAVLITIPLSHFCEKARWALDWLGLPYREEPHAPLLHRLATRRADGGSVPVLVHGDTRLTDSTDILQWADAACGGGLLYPLEPVLRREVEALEERFDTELGPHTRRWGYALLLPQTALLRELWTRGDLPRLEAMLVPMMTPLATRLVRATYKITPESAERSLQRVRGVFRDVDQLLQDGRRYLAGDRFTAADLTFAALAAPVLFPLESCAVLPTLDAAPAAMRDEVMRFRATDAGQFALRMFAQQRDRVATMRAHPAGPLPAPAA